MFDSNIVLAKPPYVIQTSESLYDQKPEEPTAPVATSNSNTLSAGSSFASRFEYVENVQSAELSSGGPQVLGHVAPPKSSSFFADYGMDNGFQKKSSSSKVQVSILSVLLRFRQGKLDMPKYINETLSQYGFLLI